ncbi:hypothetical protein C8035_v001563 [Colletotrichum spinosum]|uniref:Uncharacterized protein n=1 Tax=Colletotrichum spinosum TaxID=1347390 RepID=A0A4R8PZ80_9PEZI|nr:hypothetical protein C8035_v001563 [Colletotrichum spinosum]
MGGKVWTDAEECVFWRQIVPLGPKQARASILPPLSWSKLALKMQKRMGDGAKRKYTSLGLFEHYFQNIDKHHLSPNAKRYVMEHLDDLKQARDDARNAENADWEHDAVDFEALPKAKRVGNASQKQTRSKAPKSNGALRDHAGFEIFSDEEESQEALHENGSAFRSSKAKTPLEHSGSSLGGPDWHNAPAYPGAASSDRAALAAVDANVRLRPADAKKRASHGQKEFHAQERSYDRGADKWHNQGSQSIMGDMNRTATSGHEQTHGFAPVHGYHPYGMRHLPQGYSNGYYTPQSYSSANYYPNSMGAYGVVQPQQHAESAPYRHQHHGFYDGMGLEAQGTTYNGRNNQGGNYQGYTAPVAGRYGHHGYHGNDQRAQMQPHTPVVQGQSADNQRYAPQAPPTPAVAPNELPGLGHTTAFPGNRLPPINNFAQGGQGQQSHATQSAAYSGIRRSLHEEAPHRGPLPPILTLVNQTPSLETAKPEQEPCMNPNGTAEEADSQWEKRLDGEFQEVEDYQTVFGGPSSRDPSSGGPSSGGPSAFGAQQ